MRNKIEKFIISNSEIKHPNYIFITTVLLTLSIMISMLYYIKLYN
jgi:hypothetical protein